MNNFYTLAEEVYAEDYTWEVSEPSNEQSPVEQTFGHLIDHEELPKTLDGVQLIAGDRLYFNVDINEINESAEVAELPYAHLKHVN